MAGSPQTKLYFLQIQVWCCHLLTKSRCLRKWSMWQFRGSRMNHGEWSSSVARTSPSQSNLAELRWFLDISFQIIFQWCKCFTYCLLKTWNEKSISEFDIFKVSFQQIGINSTFPGIGELTKICEMFSIWKFIWRHTAQPKLLDWRSGITFGVLTDRKSLKWLIIKSVDLSKLLEHNCKWLLKGLYKTYQKCYFSYIFDLAPQVLMNLMKSRCRRQMNFALPEFIAYALYFNWLTH